MRPRPAGPDTSAPSVTPPGCLALGCAGTGAGGGGGAGRRDPRGKRGEMGKEQRRRASLAGGRAGPATRWPAARLCARGPRSTGHPGLGALSFLFLLPSPFPLSP